jgi:hypothetical protein
MVSALFPKGSERSKRFFGDLGNKKGYHRKAVVFKDDYHDVPHLSEIVVVIVDIGHADKEGGGNAEGDAVSPGFEVIVFTEPVNGDGTIKKDNGNDLGESAGKHIEYFLYVQRHNALGEEGDREEQE